MFVTYFACALLSLGLTDGMLYRVLPRTGDSGVRSERSADDLQITELVVTSNVSLRFANVTVSGEIRNTGSEDQEASFEIRIPKSAFITSFVLFIGNKMMTAVVKEKWTAEREYQEALTQDVTAGHVTQQTQVTDDFDRDIFKIAVNIAAMSSARISLQYQELIERSAGVYIQRLYVDPSNVVSKLEVNCEYRELQTFKLFRYRNPFDDKAYSIDEDERLENGFYKKSFKWQPLDTDLEELVATEKPLEIEYDLVQDENGGPFIYNGRGDFAQFFSPPCQEADILAKEIVFVIDVSGSMKGTRISQVRVAMKNILNQLRTKDFFNIVLFQSGITKWMQHTIQATSRNIERGHTFVHNNVIASGGTNINRALLSAMTMFSGSNASIANAVYGQIIVLLTDGGPTVGTTDTEAIRLNVRSSNYHGGVECCKTVVHTIAFGTAANVVFLRRLANENGGIAYVVKESQGEDVDQELVEFYDNMENPLYRNVSFTFSADGRRLASPDVTKSEFTQFDCGSELVVGGSTPPGMVATPRITANGISGKVEFDSISARLADGVNAELLSRLVMYKKVRDIIKQAEIAIDPADRQKAKDLAVNASLQYQFVTPYTSLLVTVHKKSSPLPRPQDRSMFGAGMPPAQTSRSNGGAVRDYDGGIAGFEPEEMFPRPETNGVQRISDNFVTLLFITALLLML